MAVRDIYCPQCRLQQPAEHSFCVRCSTPLPSHLLEPPAKRVNYFAGIKVSDDDPEQAFLRVSCYLKEQTFTSPEGSVTIPGHHVRFSVWIDSEARCVMSLPEAEARELAQFIQAELGRLEANPVR